MTTPDNAQVVLDDPTKQFYGPKCYDVAANVKVDATITLSLKVVIPSGGSIMIGGIQIELQ